MNLTYAKIQTSQGDIFIEMDEDKAPVSTKNFIDYVEKGFYDGTIFHRVIRNFMIQGGGFDVLMEQKDTADPIKNEANNGLKNDIMTISMARTSEINSATSQFFINLADNNFLNHSGQDFGYAVFGKVAKGQEVVKEIGTVKTGNKGSHSDVPEQEIIIEKVIIKNQI